MKPTTTNQSDTARKHWKASKQANINKLETWEPTNTKTNTQKHANKHMQNKQNKQTQTQTHVNIEDNQNKQTKNIQT